MESIKQKLELIKLPDEIIRIFGLILYTDENPHLVKVLRDDDYWNALDSVTGQKWCVFSVKPEKGRYDYPTPRPGMMCMMVPIWKEPNSNRELLEEFKLEDTKSLPQLVVFTETKKGKILSIAVKLKETSQEESFNHLSFVLRQISNAVQRIDKENRNDYESVFNAVSMEIEGLKLREFLKGGVGLYAWVKSLIP